MPADASTDGFGRRWTGITLTAYAVWIVGLLVWLLSGKLIVWLAASALYLGTIVASAVAHSKRQHVAFWRALSNAFTTPSLGAYVRSFKNIEPPRR